MSEIARIADQMQRAFRGEAWHGPALMELLAKTDASTAAAKPIQEAHSIWEIVLHIAAWNKAVRRRIGGEAVHLPLHEDWPAVPKFTEQKWQATVRSLEQSHEALLETVRNLNDARLTEQVPGKEYDVYFMLHGIVQHGLYHAGQIAILRHG